MAASVSGPPAVDFMQRVAPRGECRPSILGEAQVRASQYSPNPGDGTEDGTNG